MTGMWKNTKAIAILSAVFLSLLVALGSTGVRQTVPISRLPGIDSGTIVTVVGVLTDMCVFDSGIESLVIADFQSGEIARVLCSHGIEPMPSEALSIGDEISATGEVSSYSRPPTIYAISDDVELRKASEDVLTIQILAVHWQVFAGDSVTVKGVLELDACASGPRLIALDGSCSICIMCNQLEVGHLDRRVVTVTGTFALDPGSMTFVINAADVRTSSE